MATIGVVILNYKTYKDTIRLAKDLLSFSISDSLRIVMVDNQSPNESYECLKKEFSGIENVDVISSGENGGYAKGNNVGLRWLEQYTPDYALILNNDVWFDEKTLTICIERYNILENVGAISPMQLLPSGEKAYVGTLRCNTFLEDITIHSPIINQLRKKRKYTSNTSDKNLMEVDIIPGCFIFIDFKLFKSIGYFDEDTFLFCEERFLYKKLNQRGYSNYILLDQGYIHDHSLTIKNEIDHIRQNKMYNDGQIAYAKKYRRLPALSVPMLRLACWLGNIERAMIHLIKRPQTHK